jgi:pimeloyl-ACP methyl ester carboxylesterase
MADLFRAYKVDGAAIPGYFIESTAPDNLDDRFTAPPPLRAKLTPLNPNEAIAEIVDHLAEASDPNLVLMIHGFNNPRKVVLDRYAAAFDAVNQDHAVFNRRGLVCIGYRWPSERIGTPLWTAFSAAPRILIGLLVVGILLLGVAQVVGSALGLGAFVLAIPITAILLYIAVYFRDGYRATSYGIPDLVEIIRQIDKKLSDKEGESGRKNWVELSFIGHSMGAYVVTSVIRILSDVFAPASVKPGLQVGVTEPDGMSDATRIKATTTARDRQRVPLDAAPARLTGYPRGGVGIESRQLPGRVSEPVQRGLSVQQRRR